MNRKNLARSIAWGLLCGWLLSGTAARPVWAAGGQLKLTVVDYETHQPLACRIHLKTQAGKPRLFKSLPAWHDHFVFDGQLALKLPRGHYQFEIERGPEYVNAFGHFEIEDGADDQKTVELKRGVDMAKAGWWSGEFDAQRPTRDLALLMAAEDLYVLPQAPLADKRNPKSTLVDFDRPPTPSPEHRVYDLRAARDDRDGGPLLFFRLPQSLDFEGPRYGDSDGLDRLLNVERSTGVWVDAPQPSAWDLPLWLAAGEVDSIELANQQLCRPPAKIAEAPGKPRDAQRFQGPRGQGLWSQFIYYQVLNAGLRIPPSAGSGSGRAPNPLGYNRMYVYVGEDFSYDGWWEGLRAGKVVVTNGPLIQPIVAGKRPGHVFRAAAGEMLDFDINLNLTTRDPISYLEIVKNGEVERAVRIDEWASHGGRLPALTFRESGWFLIRAVTDVDQTYRFASTGPYYVEIGDDAHYVSRRAAQFFLDWIEERIALLAKAPTAKQVNLAPFEQARAFWQQRLTEANAD